MKIVHLCLGCFFFDNSTYQENLISKYHKLLGHEVEVIAPSVNQVEGKFVIINKHQDYVNDYGVHVVKLEYKKPLKLAKKLCMTQGVKEALEKAKPDVLFIHGLQSLSLRETLNYIKINRNMTVYVDNHVDFYNSAKNVISREILHKKLWRHNAKLLTPYVKKFYGVLPARVDFLTDVYKIPSSKVDLLVLGVDDELLEEVHKNDSRKQIREKYGVDDKTILIVTGGKINKDRPETIQLIKAVTEINRDDIRILVFGKPSDELKQEFDIICNSNKVINVGWANTKEIYEYFSAGDLIAFPGLHSVLWEQAVGSGKPCIFRKIKGFTHIDLGGNCVFFDDYTSSGMARQILEIIENNKISYMNEKAQLLGKPYFSYKEIAKRSVQE